MTSSKHNVFDFQPGSAKITVAVSVAISVTVFGIFFENSGIIWEKSHDIGKPRYFYGDDLACGIRYGNTATLAWGMRYSNTVPLLTPAFNPQEMGLNLNGLKLKKNYVLVVVEYKQDGKWVKNNIG